MSAKAEIAEYLTTTRFGGRKRVVREARWTRPVTRDEEIRQIEATYRHNKWGRIEQAANSRLLGLEPKATIEYTDDELKIILDDFEKYGMILYEN